jgi:hypothetical protein
VGVEGSDDPLLHPRQPAIGRVGLDTSSQQLKNQRVDIDVLHAQVFGQGLGDPGLPDRLGAIEHYHGRHRLRFSAMEPKVLNIV